MPADALLWYVHHQGLGHWRRALAVGAVSERPVVAASTAAPPQPLPDHWRWLPLPADHDGDAASPPVEPTAHGWLHWAPRGHAGLLARHRLLLDAAAGCTSAVVDVSVEVTVLLRLSGMPVTAVRLPGERSDLPHRLGFGLADRVVAPVPAGWLPDPDTVTGVGLVSGRARAPVPHDPDGPVLVVHGRGGHGPAGSETWDALAEAAGRRVRHLGAGGAWADAASAMDGASVVVAAAGLGTVADTAAACRPFVVLPEARPFGEQQATARALAADRLAVVIDAPPSVDGWRAALAAARRLDPSRLHALAGGAAEFAALLEPPARAEVGR